MSSREPVRIVSAVESAWLVLLGGSAFTDLLPVKVTALLVLATAAAKAGAAAWARSQVTPVADPKTSEGERLILPALVATAVSDEEETSADVQARVGAQIGGAGGSRGWPFVTTTTGAGGAGGTAALPDPVEPPVSLPTVEPSDPPPPVMNTKRFP